MKKFTLIALAILGMTLANTADAGWGTCHYGGYHPKWMFWKHRTACSKEEERWQRFWHDYYDALEHYYDRLDNIDWVAYYKFHGHQTNGGGYGFGGPCPPGGPPQFAPVFVNAGMQWANPGGMHGMPCAGGVCTDPTMMMPGPGGVPGVGMTPGHNTSPVFPTGGFQTTTVVPTGH